MPNTNNKISQVEEHCLKKGIKMTGQRKIIAKVLSNSNDHPDVEQLLQRASKIDPKISIATIYRTMRLFEEHNIIERHEFGDGRARYEEAPRVHHDHIIDMRSGKVIEFQNDEIEKLQRQIAEDRGFDLVDHKLELYVTPKENQDS
jgi:Fur family ferric uptake transcriptional regulator